MIRPRIAVVGSLNADLTLPVDHLPGRGETVLASAPGRQVLGGKGANQAAAAAAFGAEVTMVGRVGDDDIGHQILADLSGRGIDIAGVTVTPGARSGYATIAVDPRGENLIIVDPGANNLLSEADVGAANLSAAAVVLVQLEIPLAAAAAAMRAATSPRVMLNPAPARALPPPMSELADVIVANRTELAQLAGVDPPAGLSGIAGLARTLPGHADVIVTLGQDGALIAPASGGPLAHIMAPRVEVVDTTGAGDCFCGTLAACVAEGMALPEAARWSVAAAAISTTAHGARGRLPGRAEVAALAYSLRQRTLR
jgi:ribokinase